MAKTLKFKGFKAKWILAGEKSATLRLFDDKDIKTGDDLELVNSDTRKVFALAKVTGVIEKPLKEITVSDLDGHEKWETTEEMLDSLQKYYGESIGPETTAKIVRFQLQK